MGFIRLSGLRTAFSKSRLFSPGQSNPFPPGLLPSLPVELLLLIVTDLERHDIVQLIRTCHNLHYQLSHIIANRAVGITLSQPPSSNIRSPLHLYAADLNPRALRALLKRCMSFSNAAAVRSVLNIPDCLGLTPLLSAIISNPDNQSNDRFETVRLLLNYGAAPEPPCCLRGASNQGTVCRICPLYTPLMYATSLRYYDIMALLLARGIDGGKDIHLPPYSPLAMAFSTRDAEAIRMVLEKGGVDHRKWGMLVALAVDKAGWEDVGEACREALGEGKWKRRERFGVDRFGGNVRGLPGKVPKPVGEREVLRGARKAEDEMRGRGGKRWKIWI